MRFVGGYYKKISLSVVLLAAENKRTVIDMVHVIITMLCLNDCANLMAYQLMDNLACGEFLHESQVSLIKKAQRAPVSDVSCV